MPKLCLSLAMPRCESNRTVSARGPNKGTISATRLGDAGKLSAGDRLSLHLVKLVTSVSMQAATDPGDIPVPLQPRPAVAQDAALPPLIGVDLETQRTRLSGYAQELMACVPGQLAAYIADTPDLLRTLSCTIAVIGQVKAGKSSFINAFIQRPGFLPTNVNPWTTAVTHLHFKSASAPTDVGARFTFFEKDEWSNIVEGGGRIRELTERFVPGFDVQLLEHHVNAMRRRCRERLGPEFETLLGTTRDFATVDPARLSEFICAGTMGASSGPDDTTGKYSDIVKRSDLYIETSPFAFPTTVIDTPGTNDPFLVRDEITRRALADADIHVVVLTARQALSIADLSLLRILHGLNKGRVILFINRIDELSNVSADVKQILDDVRQRLHKAFPENELRVVAGSALWAQMACDTASPNAANPAWRKALAYAAHLGIHGISPVIEANIASTVLRQCSGLSALNAAISEMMLDSRAGHVVRQVGSAIREIAQLSPPILLRTVSELLSEGSRDTVGKQSAETELREIEQEVRQSERLLQFVHSVQVDIHARTTEVVSAQTEGLVEQLQFDLDTFVGQECAALRQFIYCETWPRVWTARPDELRRTLEQSYLSILRDGEKSLADLEIMIIAKLKAVVEKLDPTMTFEPAATLATAGRQVSVAALRRTIALDLDEPWWKRWWFGAKDGFERATEADRLIRSEFEPILDELKASAHNYLVARQSAVMKRITGVCITVFETLREMSSARFERLQALLNERDEQKTLERSREREAKIAELREKVLQIERIERELAVTAAPASPRAK